MKQVVKSRWFLPVSGLVIGLAAILLISLALRPHQFAGTILQSPESAYNFTLNGPGQTTVSLTDFRGKVVLLFFGYTRCPDVCPTTLHEESKVLDLLGNQAQKVQPIFISVDPERDSPQRLKAYLNNLDGRIIGLTGNIDVINKIATQYGVFFQKRTISADGNYLVDHTATTFLVDQDGYLRVIYAYATPARGIAEDVKYILAH